MQINHLFSLINGCTSQWGVGRPSNFLAGVILRWLARFCENVCLLTIADLNEERFMFRIFSHSQSFKLHGERTCLLWLKVECCCESRDEVAWRQVQVLSVVWRDDETWHDWPHQTTPLCWLVFNATDLLQQSVCVMCQHASHAYWCVGLRSVFLSKILICRVWFHNTYIPHGAGMLPHDAKVSSAQNCASQHTRLTMWILQSCMTECALSLYKNTTAVACHRASAGTIDFRGKFFWGGGGDKFVSSSAARVQLLTVV